MKTSELIGPALDWAVAKCEGREIEIVSGERIINLANTPTPRALAYPVGASRPFDYTTNWVKGGPIIEREKINLIYDDFIGEWKTLTIQRDQPLQFGPTSLIAAMRCYVASKLGDEVEIPEELQSVQMEVLG